MADMEKNVAGNEYNAAEIQVLSLIHISEPTRH